MSTPDALALPFDQFQRYRAAAQVADLVRIHLDRTQLHILDVGGLSLGLYGDCTLPLVQFIPQDDVFAVDVVARSLPNYSLASGLSLPFGDKRFDLVVTCDTLEHIPPDGRSAFLAELLRVANCYLVLTAPFDSDSNREAERILQEYLTARQVICPPLQEHAEHGLPSIDGLRAELSERCLAAVDFADGYLPHWLAMMLVTFTPGQSQTFHQALNRYYNTYFSPGDRMEPAYRHVFVVALPGNEALLPTITSALAPAAPQVGSSDLGFAADLIDVLMTHGQDSASQLLQQLHALEVENLRLQQLVTGYEQGRFMRLMRHMHNWRKKVGI